MTLTALIAGCGGAYTKSDFIARADAICATAVRETRSAAPPQTGPQQLSALAQYLAEILPVVQSEVSQIRALKRPSGDTRDGVALSRYLQASARDVGYYRALAAAAKRGDAQGVASDEAALRASPVTSLAASYGLRSCGTPGATVT